MADGYNPPELRSYTPTLREKLVAALAGATGDTRESHAAANRLIAGPVEPVLGTSLADVVTWPYDVARGVSESVRKIAKALSDSPTLDSATEELSREEFMSRRRKPMKGKDDFIQEEVDKVRNSEAYQELGPKGRAKREDEARINAGKRYEAMLESQGTEDKRFEAEWQSELQDRDRRRLAEQSKSFAERHPGTAAAISLGGLPATALVGGMAMRKINKSGQRIVDEMTTARNAGDKMGQAEAILKADSYSKNANRDKLVAALGAPLVNVEARALPDQIDAVSLPPEAPARKAAMDRMSNVPEYLLHSVPSYIGGVAGTYTGSKVFGGKNPRDQIAGSTGYLRGMDDTISTQDLALALARADRRVARAQAPSAPGLPPDRQVPGGQAPGLPSLPPMQGQPSGGLMSGVPDGPLPMPPAPSGKGQSRASRTPSAEQISQELEQLPAEQRLPHLLSRLGIR